MWFSFLLTSTKQLHRRNTDASTVSIATLLATCLVILQYSFGSFSYLLLCHSRCGYSTGGGSNHRFAESIGVIVPAVEFLFLL